jgi:hypothetical protein
LKLCMEPIIIILMKFSHETTPENIAVTATRWISTLSVCNYYTNYESCFRFHSKLNTRDCEYT